MHREVPRLIGCTERDAFGWTAVSTGCERPRPGYDKLPARRFEFVPLWESADGTLDVELRVNPVDDALLDGLAAFGKRVTREDVLVRLTVAAESILPELARWWRGPRRS